MSQGQVSLTEAVCRVMVDPAIERKEINGFAFPLGTYPTEPLTPVAGYTVQFEPADGSDPTDFAGEGFSEELEEWPDRYVFDILVPHNRLRPMYRALMALMPGRFFPILDVLGHDAFREIDPYIAYQLVGFERVSDAVRAYDPFFFEDGLVGFGGMSVDPFCYVFVDEHKIMTVRAVPEMKERIEKLLASFDLGVLDELAGADSVAHEHRGVIVAPDDQPEALTPDEVIERLRDDWNLELNIDVTTNIDGEGNELGITAWQCIARCLPSDENTPPSYAEVLLTAANLQEAERLSEEAVSSSGPGGQKREWEDAEVIRADRIPFEQLNEWLGAGKTYEKAKPGVHDVRWLTADSTAAPSPPGAPGITETPGTPGAAEQTGSA